MSRYEILAKGLVFNEVICIDHDCCYIQTARVNEKTDCIHASSCKDE